MKDHSPSRLALITGATSGIGLATAKIFAEHGINLILCGRRKERLQAMAEELKVKVSVHTLSFDVGVRGQVMQAISSLPPELRSFDILINNAGNAHGLDKADKANLDDWDQMIDSNLKGLSYVTRASLDLMLQNAGTYKGHIVNVGSIAGKEVYPLGSMYCASKHAVDAFTKGLRMDLFDRGIKVSAIHPGAVNTEFSTVRFKGDTDRANNVYKGFHPLVAEDVAEAIYYMISRPAHVNVADMVILPTAQASAQLTFRD
jgi:3-hydroxy acid dehydrogenase/malonic semialdehyde reductase